MIVLNRDRDILLFEQHHHALVSGIMAMHWRYDAFKGEHLREQVEYAVAQHDRAWIPLDQKPLWNGDKEQPYSFIDYPMNEKMLRYQEGVDRVERRTKYGALLCCLHYLSFFPEQSDDPDIQSFITEENTRQKRLKKELGDTVQEDYLQFHFDLLQFCDDLSLYCCMNEPGVSKQHELSWFRGGFPQQFDFASDKIVAHWQDDKTVMVDSFPFRSTFYVDIPYRKLRKDQIEEGGFRKAWEDSVLSNRRVQFIMKES